ncbi:MAG: 30S ribosomal protein S20 [Solirubrobacterales bacterium]
MANIRSQIKRNARTEREHRENLRRRSEVKTWFKRLREAVESGDDSKADEEHRMLVSRIDKAVQHGGIHANNGARKKSQAARIRAGHSG